MRPKTLVRYENSLELIDVPNQDIGSGDKPISVDFTIINSAFLSSVPRFQNTLFNTSAKNIGKGQAASFNPFVICYMDRFLFCLCYEHVFVSCLCS